MKKRKTQKANEREPLHKIVGSSVYSEKCRYIHYLVKLQQENRDASHAFDS